MENLRNFKMQPAKPQGTEDGIFIVQAQIRVDVEQLLNSLLQSYRRRLTFCWWVSDTPLVVCLTE